MGARIQMALPPLRTKRPSFRQALSDPGGFGALCGNEKNVAEAVVAETALAVEVALPFVGCRKPGDSVGQLGDEFRVVVCGAHC
jgi:hypothetical protein